MKSRLFVVFMVLLLVVSVFTVSAGAQKEAVAEKPLIGFITNGPYEFWTYSAAAVEILKKDLDIDVEFLLPPNGLPEEQKRFIESLVTRGVDGIG
ncbi:MAG: hypothetical protein CVV52_16055, partial [Spirochaetae bacterium HGW-Spirochaetae-8]